MHFAVLDAPDPGRLEHELDLCRRGYVLLSSPDALFAAYERQLPRWQLEQLGDLPAPPEGALPVDCGEPKGQPPLTHSMLDEGARQWRGRKKSGESPYEIALGALGVALAAGIPTIQDHRARCVPVEPSLHGSQGGSRQRYRSSRSRTVRIKNVSVRRGVQPVRPPRPATLLRSLWPGRDVVVWPSTLPG
jgi:hypothetical protein